MDCLISALDYILLFIQIVAVLLFSLTSISGLIDFFLKNIIMVKMHGTVSEELVHELVRYLICKGAFIPFIVPRTIHQAALWSAWLTLLCTLKMLQALATDELKKLNASPSTTPSTYFRIYKILLLVLYFNLAWMWICLRIYLTEPLSMYLLLFIEPLSIAFETLKAILVHGYQLLDIWLRHSTRNNINSEISKYLDMLASGSLRKWRPIILQEGVFFLDIMTLLMALGHDFHIWRIDGIPFGILFVHSEYLMDAIGKRTLEFIHLKMGIRGAT